MYVPKSCDGCLEASKTKFRIGVQTEEMFFCLFREWGPSHWMMMAEGAECARRVKEEERIRIGGGIPFP